LVRICSLIDKDLVAVFLVLKPEDLHESIPGVMAAEAFLSNAHNLHARVFLSRIYDSGSCGYNVLGRERMHLYDVMTQAFSLERKWRGDYRQPLAENTGMMFGISPKDETRLFVQFKYSLKRRIGLSWSKPRAQSRCLEKGSAN